MEIRIDITKTRFFLVLGALLLASGMIFVQAYNTNSPSNFGHTVGEINWNDPISLLKIGTPGTLTITSNFNNNGKFLISGGGSGAGYPIQIGNDAGGNDVVIPADLDVSGSLVFGDGSSLNSAVFSGMAVGGGTDRRTGVNWGSRQCTSSWGIATCQTGSGVSILTCPSGTTKVFTSGETTEVINLDGIIHNQGTIFSLCVVN